MLPWEGCLGLCNVALSAQLAQCLVCGRALVQGGAQRSRMEHISIHCPTSRRMQARSTRDQNSRSYGTFAMFPDLGYIKWFNTLPGRVRWIGYAPKPLETCLVRPGAGASSPETVMRFHSNRRHHESSQARLDQAHAPPTTPRKTKATSPMTLRLRRGGKEVEKGVDRPQVVGGKSSGGV